MRRLTLSLATAVLGLGALFGAAGTAVAHQQLITPERCEAGGGAVTPSGSSLTGLECVGGSYNGAWVIA